MIITNRQRFEGNDFAIQIMAKGHFIDHSVGDKNSYIVEATTIRLNRIAFDEWLNTRVYNGRDTYNNEEQWLEYKTKKEELDNIWTNKIIEDLGLDPKKGSVSITQAVSEVFTVVYIFPIISQD